MNDPVKLVRIGGDTSIYIDVCINEKGDLLFSGQDIGDAPEEIFGDSDYEYWLTVPASEKDRLLLALIEKHYAGMQWSYQRCGNLWNPNRFPAGFIRTKRIDFHTNRQEKWVLSEHAY